MTARLADVPEQELLNELQRRGTFQCPCGRWGAYMGRFDTRDVTLRCFGCVRPVEECTCG